MYPQAYLDFLTFFHGPRDYFECHEILEEFWKQNNSEGKESIWVGFIQFSVALYHHRIENYRGSARLLKKAIAILDNKCEEILELGIDKEKFFLLLKKRLTEIENMQLYYSLTIPIIDEDLLHECIDRCKQMGYKWNSPSDLSNINLIRKHSLRDRTEVINERYTKLNLNEMKHKNRPDS